MLKSLGMIIAALLIPGSAAAYKCRPVPKEVQVSQYELIFVGFIESAKVERPGDDQGSYASHRVLVRYPIKGKVKGDVIEVRTAVRYADCSESFSVGFDYLFYLNEESSGTYRVSACNPTESISARSRQQKIEEVQKALQKVAKSPVDPYCAGRFPEYADCFAWKNMTGHDKCACSLPIDSLDYNDKAKQVVLCGKQFREGDQVLDVRLKRLTARTAIFADGKRTVCVRRMGSFSPRGIQPSEEDVSAGEAP